MQTAAILGVDGTLVDTNYHHTLAWGRAFEAADVFESAVVLRERLDSTPLR